MAFTLRSAPASPFARKVRIGAHVVGLIDDIELQGGPSGDDDVIYQQNPLGKIPVLVTADGRAIYDSPVILEYLDAITTPGSLIPTESGARFDALRLQALADGILDAAILIIYEGRYRPDQQPYEPWLDFQRGKIERTLDVLARAHHRRHHRAGLGPRLPGFPQTGGMAGAQSGADPLAGRLRRRLPRLRRNPSRRVRLQ